MQDAPFRAILRANGVFRTDAGQSPALVLPYWPVLRCLILPQRETGCASPLTSMFFAALTLLLRSLPQSGHLNRILFLSCADASNLATPHLLHVREIYAGSTRTTEIPAPSALYVRICANSPHVCSSIVRLAAGYQRCSSQSTTVLFHLHPDGFHARQRCRSSEPHPSSGITSGPTARSANPLKFSAAFSLRSCCAPHSVHTQCLSRPSSPFTTPQAKHVLELGYHLSANTISVPYHSAL